jgi:hypothetical protein
MCIFHSSAASVVNTNAPVDFRRNFVGVSRGQSDAWVFWCSGHQARHLRSISHTAECEKQEFAHLFVHFSLEIARLFLKMRGSKNRTTIRQSRKMRKDNSSTVFGRKKCLPVCQ